MVIIQARGNDVGGYKTYLSLMAGDTLDVTVVFEILTNGEYEPINISGADIKSTIGLSTPLELTIDNGGIIVEDAINGIIRMVIDSSITALWKPCQFPFDLWVFPSIGTANNYLNGFINVSRGETEIA